MRRGAPILLASMLLVAACGEASIAEPDRISDADIAINTAPPVPAPATTEIPEPVPEPEPDPKETHPVYQGFAADLGTTSSLVAATSGETVIYEGPSRDEELMTLDAKTILGTGTVLGVLSQGPGDWVEVLLPVRPNGTTGWVNTADVALYVVEGKITVDLSDRHLSYVVNGEEVFASTVAVGKSSYPTPTGEFYVTDSVAIASGTGPWGPHALGLSARSETITEFNGGDGIIGIHGTNNPSSIGKAASLGCVRLPNEMITELFSLVPIGTPVEIRA